MLVMAIDRRERHAGHDPRGLADANVAVGGPEQVAEQIKTKVLDAGIDGVILSPITNMSGYHPGGITAVAEKLKPLIEG